MGKNKKKKKKKKSRIGLVIFLFLFLLVLIVGLKMGLEGKQLYDQAKIAKHDIDGVLADISSENYESAQYKANEIHGVLKNVRSTLEGPLWKELSHVPKYGSDFTAACKLLQIADEAMDDLMDEAFSLLKDNPLGNLMTGSGFNMTSILAYLDYAESLVPKVEDLVNQVSSIEISLDKTGLIQHYTDKAKELFGLYHQAEGYIPLLRTVLGDGSDRLLLLIAQNSAEIRGSGGFPGSIGTIRIQDGTLTIGDFESSWHVLPFDLNPVLGPTDNEVYLFGWGMYYPRDACYDPYFPRCCEIWAFSYEERMGEHVDGVISLSPIIIQKLLACTGAIELSDGTVLDGTNATKFIQNEIYIKYLNYYELEYGREEGNDISDQLFAETAELAMKSAFSNLSIDKIPAFMDMFEEGSEDRIIMMWMNNEQEEELICQYGCDGGFNEDPMNPEVGVYVGNANPSKLGWYLDLDIRIGEPTTLADGSLNYPCVATMTNTIDWNTVNYAGSYVAGEVALGPIFGSIYLVAPAGGYITGSWMDNGNWMATSSYYGHQIDFNSYFTLNPESSVNIYFNVVCQAGSAPLGINHTPTLQDYR